MAFLFTGSVLMDIIVIAITFFIVLYSSYSWSYMYWKRKNLSYIEPSFPFGNFQNPLSKSKRSFGDQITKIYQVGKSKGWKHFGIWSMQKPVYVVTHLEYVKNILLKDFNYFVDRGSYVNEKGDPLSAHLFAIGGDKWRNLRRKLTPTFTSGKMKGMFHTIAECGSLLEKVFRKEIQKKEPIDIKDILGNFTTDVIGSCAFGLECHSFEDESSPFRVYGKKVFEGSPVRNLGALIKSNAPKLAKILNLPQLPKDVTSFFMDVVKNTIKYRQENNVVRKDFLQLLMDIKSDSEEYKGDGNTLTTNEIAAQCFVFFLAGFETSATTMTFALFELANNQKFQDKVRNEICEVLQKHEGKITYDSINDMHYMGQVIDETLRKYPPVPFITRKCVKDYKVPDADLIIEKGTSVMIPIRGIHHDEEHFPDPQKFDPDRFSEANKHKIKHFSYMPFGEGNRICIGARFGIMQSKVGLTVLLKKYRFTVNKKTIVPLQMNPHSFVATAKGDVWLDCEEI